MLKHVKPQSLVEETPISHPEMVLVEWTDACSVDDWVDINDIELALVETATIGWLVYEDSRGIIVSSTYTGEHLEVACSMSIGWNMIRRIVKLQTGATRRSKMPKHTPAERKKKKKKSKKNNPFVGAKKKR